MRGRLLSARAALERLLEAGALDASFSPLQMKKNRPGVLLGVLCQLGDTDRLETIVFRETGTLGVRRSALSRRKLPRQPHQVQTQWGAVDGILATLPDGQQSFSPEYEACRKIAAEKNVPVREVYDAAKKQLTMSAHFSDPASRRLTILKTVTTLVDANNWVYDEYTAHAVGEKESHTMSITYKR
jgi:uncharacterized protein (DUF111 family)